jgi:hypothetical protein
MTMRSANQDPLRPAPSGVGLRGLGPEAAKPDTGSQDRMEAVRL